MDKKNKYINEINKLFNLEKLALTPEYVAIFLEHIKSHENLFSEEDIKALQKGPKYPSFSWADELKCVCGAESLGYNTHSNWCSKGDN